MRLIITDVTEMHGGTFCAAAWNANKSEMIRPLPNGGNWTAELLQQHAIVPGATIVVTPTGQSLNSSYPHRTEDIVVDPATIENIHSDPMSWSGAEAPRTHSLVSEVFGDHLGNSGSWDGALKGVHVPENTQIGSLGAVRDLNPSNWTVFG